MVLIVNVNNRKYVFSFSFIVGVLICFLILFSFILTYSDELFYFNISKQIAKGLNPYIDFFFAHPLFQVITLIPFSSSFFLLRSFSIMISLGSFFLFVKISEKEFSKKSYFLLFSPFFLSFFHMGLGENFSLFFLFISYFFLLKNKESFAGFFFSIAFFSRYISLLFFPLFFSQTKRKLNFFRSFFLFSFFFFLFHFFIGGFSFLEDTFLYHSSKIGFSSFYFFKNYLVLSLFPLLFIFLEKIKEGRIFYLFFVDSIMLFFFKKAFITYFIISNAFIFLFISKYVKKEHVFLLFLTLFFAFKPVVFYHSHNSLFSELDSFFKDKQGSVVFGDPLLVNYLNYSQNISVYGNFFDSFSSEMSDIDEDNPPDFIISTSIMDNEVRVFNSFDVHTFELT